MGGQKLAESRQEPVSSEDRDGGNAQPMAAATVTGDGTRQIGEGTARRRREQAARRRQFDAARLTFEEPFAQRPFQAGDAMADGRGRDMQRLARRLERAMARGEVESLQREKISRRQLGVGQNASAGIAISVAPPALIWWLSDVVCGRTLAM